MLEVTTREEFSWFYKSINEVLYVINLEIKSLQRGSKECNDYIPSYDAYN
jgi:hypothetical protein